MLGKGTRPKNGDPKMNVPSTSDHAL